MDRFKSLPAEWPANLWPHIQTQVRTGGRTMVVLDDDPTGTQTVHDILVLTEWSVDSLRAELANDLSCFYLLTNSRSLPLAQAQLLNADIARNLRAASQQARRDFVVVSRSDSTLRGHFPGEVDALVNALGQNCDGWLIIPFFMEGGRYTINDVHYVAEGAKLVPAAETPFARDSAFGYRSSNLREWIAEKTGGRVHANEVASVSINDLRVGGPKRVTEKLMALSHGQMCVVNAASYRDIEVLVAGLLEAEARSKRFLYRTAASFVRVRAGIQQRALLTKSELRLPASGGGLVVVGSYVPKTTAQIETLLAQTKTIGVEIDVSTLLGERQQDEIGRVASQSNHALRQNQDVVIYTRRQLITANDANASLAIGQRVSDSLIEILHRISTIPRYLIAKGGITSSDVATKGLNVKRAVVLGQILPGVPVWQLGEESRFPGLAYIVFPGNVGAPNALAEIVKQMK